MDICIQIMVLTSCNLIVITVSTLGGFHVYNSKLQKATKKKKEEKSMECWKKGYDFVGKTGNSYKNLYPHRNKVR